MYAVIKTGGKQYKVSEGDIIEVEKLKAKDNKEYLFDKVLLYVVDSSVKVGKPYLPEVVVKGVILSAKKGPKIRVSKFKAKSRYRRTMGHRQSLTQVKIERITEKGKTEEKKVVTKKTSAKKKSS